MDFFSIATVFAIVCTIPFAAIQIWLFVKPGLHPNEQKMTIMYIPVLSMLFIAGLCFGYFIVMPFLFHFLTTIGNEMFNTMFTTEKYFHFVLNLTVPFAVIFELPVVVMFLTSIGILTAEFLIKIRRYAYVALIIIASCISPPDFLSHSLVAVPLICIYEVSIALSKVVSKRKRKEKNAVEKCLVIKALFIYLLYYSYKRIQYIEEKIIESPKFRQTLRFYKLILNVLNN